MRCPKCGARIPHESPICFNCGTRLTQIREASFLAVREAKRTYQPEKIVYSTIFPKDLSYPKTLLMCIFLGLFGGHYFYIQRYPMALFYLIFSVYFLACAIIPGAIYGFQEDFTVAIQSVYNTPVLEAIFVMSCVCGILVVALWLRDIIAILCKRFKVPVVLKEK